MKYTLPRRLRALTSSRPPLWSNPEMHSHAAAGGNLAAVPEPSDLRPGEAVYPRRVHQGALALGHGLGSLGLHEASHIWWREKTRWRAGGDKGGWGGGG